MIHPCTELKRISLEIGYGVFATALIPKGTIVYVKDPMDIELTQSQFDALDEMLHEQADRFSYIDERGIRILSWDMAKYVNHRCDCNTMSTGYGFEVAIRDISPGEEVTDEYGLFNIASPMPLSCGCASCRGVLMPDDVDVYYPIWDQKVQDALTCLESVPQPLWSLLDAETIEQVTGYLRHRLPYKSVRSLKVMAGPHIIEMSEVMAQNTGVAKTRGILRKKR